MRLPEVSDDELSDLSRWFNAFLTSLEEKKKIEEELMKSQEQYRSVVDRISEVIFQTDERGSWTFLNPAWTEITAFSVEESVGRHCLSYIHPDDHESSSEFFGTLLSDCKSQYRHRFRCLTRRAGSFTG